MVIERRGGATGTTGVGGRLAGDPARRDGARTPPASARALPMIMAFLGILVIVLTQAVERGLVTGVTVEWPAYVVGAVMILFGIAGARRGASGPDPVVPDEGPIVESGHDPNEIDPTLNPRPKGETGA